MSRTERQKPEADLYILAGQSNMDGQGSVDDLPDYLSGIRNNAWIYSPNRRDDQQPIDDRGFWDRLRPGHGDGYQTDGERSFLSDSFGPELSFVERLMGFNSEKTVLIYKYAKGGSSIHPDVASDWGCWDPDYERGNGINQWTHFRHHLNRAIERAEKRFESVMPAGILWLQGESDASHTRTIAEAYAGNLSNLLNSIRKEAKDLTLPVVVGEISDSMMGRGKRRQTYPFGDIVKSAQRQFVEQDNYAALVTTPEDHGFIDAWHYDSQTYIDLGIRFADAIMNLRNVEKKRSLFQSNE